MYFPWKLTWQWKINIICGGYIFKWLFFYCHVRFRGCTVVVQPYPVYYDRLILMTMETPMNQDFMGVQWKCMHSVTGHGWWLIFFFVLLPRKLTYPLKNDGWKMDLPFQMVCFRGHSFINFPGCKLMGRPAGWFFEGHWRVCKIPSQIPDCGVCKYNIIIHSLKLT